MLQRDMKDLERNSLVSVVSLVSLDVLTASSVMSLIHYSSYEPSNITRAFSFSPRIE